MLLALRLLFGYGCESGCSQWQHDIMDIHYYLLFLLVFLGLIDLSKAGCKEYFTFQQWQTTFGNKSMIILETANNTEDVVKCTLHKHCREDTKGFCFVRNDCFPETDWETFGEMCSSSDTSKTSIHTYHFMCMLHNFHNISGEEVSDFCKYEAVCELQEQSKSDPTSSTTTPQSTTTTTKTIATTATTLSPTTTAFWPTTTPQPPTTTLPPQPTTTSPPLTTTTTTAAAPTSGPGSIVKESQSTDDKDGQDSLILRVLLTISLGLNLALPLLVYLVMRRGRLNFWRAAVSTETLPGAEANIELENTPHANGIAESTYLIQQPVEYPSATAPSAVAGDEADVEYNVENGMRL